MGGDGEYAYTVLCDIGTRTCVMLLLLRGAAVVVVVVVVSGLFLTDDR